VRRPGVNGVDGRVAFERTPEMADTARVKNMETEEPSLPGVGEPGAEAA
jgi:hypothetical protein